MLEDTIAGFDVTPWLTATDPNRRGVKVSTFVQGINNGTVWFWEAPGGNVYLYRAHPRFVIEQIQRAVSSAVDGRFGDLTRTALLRALASRGIEVDAAQPVNGALMAAALDLAFHNGRGRVGLPQNVQLPDVSRPALPAGNSTVVQAFDLAGGTANPVAVTQLGPNDIAPSNATTPAVPQGPTTPAAPPPAPAPPALPTIPTAPVNLAASLTLPTLGAPCPTGYVRQTPGAPCTPSRGLVAGIVAGILGAVGVVGVAVWKHTKTEDEELERFRQEQERARWAQAGGA